MAWYNENLKDDNYNRFFAQEAKRNGELQTILHCYQEQDFHDDNYENRLKQFESKIDEAWEVFKELRSNCGEAGISIIVERSHLKGHKGHKGHKGKTKRPNYGACFYVGLADYQNCLVLNIAVGSGDVFFEIRNPVAELFSIDEFCDRREEDSVKVGWINHIIQVRMNQFLNKKLPGEARERLFQDIAKYIKSIHDYVRQGGTVRVFGQSKAERIIYLDLKKIYREKKIVVAHGYRHRMRNQGGMLEIDLDVQLPTKCGSSVRFAIEIQGPYHYPQYYDNENDWLDIEDKHEAKIQWCKKNDILFVWMDWGSINRVLIKDGARQRITPSRRSLLVNLIEKLETCYKGDCRYVEIFEREGELVVLEESVRPRTFRSEN